MWRQLKMHTSVFRPNFSRLSIYKQPSRVISESRDVYPYSTTDPKPWSEIPGPKSFPVVGPLFSFLPGGEFHKLTGIDLIEALNRKYGPIVRLDKLMEKKPMLLLFDAETSAQVLRGENQTPIRSSLRSLVHYRKTHKNIPPGSSTGLLSEDGELWQRFRSTVNPVLMQPKTIRLYTPVLDEVALDMIERLKSLRDEKNMIPKLDHEMNLWSLESLGVVALGCRLKCFDKNLDKDAPVQQLIEVVMNIMEVTEEIDRIRPSLWKYYSTNSYKKAMSYYNKQEILAQHFINQAIKEFQSNPKPDDQKGILEKLLEINKDVGLVMASDMLLAGVDSVANSILGTLYLLASNPDKQSKLRAELKTNDEKTPYLKACVKEAIRMMPVVTGNSRETTKEYNILGYNIPKGVRVAFVHKLMSRMDKYFVNPQEYTPERWIVSKDDPLCYKNGHPFAYNPFGFGARACIGRRIAELEIETFIKRAIENFEIEWFGPPPKVIQQSVNYVKRTFNFIFKDAKK